MGPPPYSTFWNICNCLIYKFTYIIETTDKEIFNPMFFSNNLPPPPHHHHLHHRWEEQPKAKPCRRVIKADSIQSYYIHRIPHIIHPLPHIMPIHKTRSLSSLKKFCAGAGGTISRKKLVSCKDFANWFLGIVIAIIMVSSRSSPCSSSLSTSSLASSWPQVRFAF